MHSEIWPSLRACCCSLSAPRPQPPAKIGLQVFINNRRPANTPLDLTAALIRRTDWEREKRRRVKASDSRVMQSGRLIKESQTETG